MWRGYIACQRLDINDNQWDRLKAVFEEYGPLSDPQPAHLCHWRPSLDGSIVLYESAFDEDEVSIAGFKQALADEFGVQPADIGVIVGEQTFVNRPSPFWTFDYDGSNRFRAGIFGGLDANWEQSHIEALGYLSQNKADWEPEEI